MAKTDLKSKTTDELETLLSNYKKGRNEFKDFKNLWDNWKNLQE